MLCNQDILLPRSEDHFLLSLLKANNISSRATVLISTLWRSCYWDISAFHKLMKYSSEVTWTSIYWRRKYNCFTFRLFWIHHHLQKKWFENMRRVMTWLSDWQRICFSCVLRPWVKVRNNIYDMSPINAFYICQMYTLGLPIILLLDRTRQIF